MVPTILGIIPARGGSKSIPRKNLCLLAGKPLIAWTIETALNCTKLERVIVSTDDEEIASIARKYGAEVPYLRPSELAQDDTPGIDPIIHAVHWLSEHEGYYPQYVMSLQPTSPLRTVDNIEAAIQIALEHQCDSVVSVCSVNHHPYWMKRVTTDGYLTNFINLDQSYNCRQDLPNIYAINGAIYFIKRDVLIDKNTFFTERTYAHVMPSKYSVDIDTYWDLYLANLILEDKKKQ